MEKQFYMNIYRFESYQINMKLKKNKIIQFVKIFKESLYFREFLMSLFIVSITVYNLSYIIAATFKIIDYLSRFDNLYLGVFICLEFSIFLLTLLSWIIFIITYWSRQYIIKDLLKRFSSLPFLNKILLFNFTLFVSIPNRVYIHNQTSDIFTFCVTIYLFFLVYISPIVIFPVLIYFLITIESIVFGTLYETYDSFADQIHKKLFNNDIWFSTIYMREFWGNANSSGTQRLKIQILTTLVSGLTGMLGRTEYELEKREIEKHRSIYLKEKVELWTQSNILTHKDLSRFDEEANKKAFENHAGWMLKSIEYVNNLKKESLESDQKKSYTQEELQKIRDLQDLTAEVKRYNLESSAERKVDMSELKKKIFADNESIKLIKDLDDTKKRLSEGDQNVQNNQNLSDKEKEELMQVYKDLEQATEINLSNYMSKLKENRGSFDSDDGDSHHNSD